MHLVTSSNFQFKKKLILGLQIVFLSLLGTSFLHNCMHMSLPNEPTISMKSKIIGQALLDGWWNTGRIIYQKIEWSVCISWYLQMDWSKRFPFCNLTKVPKVRPFRHSKQPLMLWVFIFVCWNHHCKGGLPNWSIALYSIFVFHPKWHF